MKTKEEIIDECEGGDISEYPHYALDDFQRTVAKEAMDIWAKQQAVAFMKYKEDEGYILEHARQEYMKFGAAHVNAPRFSREALYDQFILKQKSESLNK